MKRKLGIAAVILLALVYLVVGSPVVFYHNHQLKKAVTAIGKEEVTLNEVVPFGWDAVYTFSPYTSREEIEKSIGFESRSIEETVSEGMVQLLFVKGEKVTASVCAYASALGYRISFGDKVAYEDEVPFAVERAGDMITLTEKQNKEK